MLGNADDASGYYVSLIVTLTINPAVDRTITVDKLVFEDRAYILQRGEAAGGRGINAARVIHAFGGKTLALLTAGGETGSRLKELLKKTGLPFEAVDVHAQSRNNFTISDKQGLTMKMNELGEPLSADELRRVEQLLEARIAKAAWLMICGSLPAGVPSNFYSKIIEMAKAKGVKTLVDTDGEELLHALEARPTVVTPNQPEAERMLGRALLTRSQSLEALARIHSMGPECVILSLGARGAVGCSPEGIFEAKPPVVDALSPIGSGDALAAAVAWALDKKKSFAEALRWGVAAGTAKAQLPGMTFPALDQTRMVYKHVEVRPAQ